MKWVRATLVSKVDLNLRPPSWLWWMKLFDTTWNWSLFPMTFSISLPKVLRKTIGLNAFGELCDILLGFDIIIVVEILKWEDQKPKLKHEFTILIKLYKHILFLRICLRWLQEILSGLGAEELLHLVIAIMNSSSENPFH